MRPKRQNPRMKTVPGISCSIYLPKLGNIQEVMIYSLAVGGMAFIVDGPHFDISEPVVVHFNINKGGENIMACGVVVNQDFYHPSDDADPRKSFYRYSVKFDKNIEDQSFIYFMQNPARPLGKSHYTR